MRHIKNIFLPWVFFLPFSLSGCLTTESGAMLAGGMTGGIIGSQFGKNNGKTASTIAGTMIGSLVGHSLARSVNYDPPYYREAYDSYSYDGYAPVKHDSFRYRRPYPKRSHYSKKFKKCRYFESAVWIDGEPESTYGRACLINGHWKIVG